MLTQLPAGCRVDGIDARTSAREIEDAADRERRCLKCLLVEVKRPGKAEFIDIAAIDAAAAAEPISSMPPPG
jgi:hypothetical protein